MRAVHLWLGGSLLLGLLSLASGAGALVSPGLEGGHAAGFASILEQDLERDLAVIGSPALEGRDSPSAGLLRAADYVAERWKSYGVEEFPSSPGYRQRWTRELSEPVPEQCRLRLEVAGGEPRDFDVLADFVPLPGAEGSASGPLVFLGFGIDAPKQGYSDLGAPALPAGAIGLIVEGEPNHKQLFDGAELSPAGDAHAKLAALSKAGLAGLIIARRAPPGVAEADAPLGFRYSYAIWPNEGPRQPAPAPFPVLEVRLTLASELLGEDVAALVAKIERSGKTQRRLSQGRVVSLASAMATRPTENFNLVGRIPGSDAKLAAEYVVVGAHLDHIGVDARDRIGAGADDNASGSCALLELAEALSLARPKRSILLCSFSAEEDGLLGSKALCRDLPVERSALVAMLNLDMIGRGDANEVAVLGTRQTPAFEALLERALKLKSPRIQKLVTGQGEELFQRSDHYSFFEIGVPVLFFFEGLPIERNPDYHTWRDTVDLLDTDKIARTARLCFNTAWLLANDEGKSKK